MTSSQLDFIDTTVQKTHRWLNQLKEHLGWTEDRRAYEALRAVLHTLRDRLSVNEAANFAAQMPLLIRGIYFEGWDPSNKPVKIRHMADFADMVLSRIDWDTGDTDGAEITRAVFKVLSEHMTPGEIQKVKDNLPEDIKELFPA
jgi:uncharacterized protein (DUF2267 family)